MSTITLRGREVSRRDVLDALADFDRVYPNTRQFDNWLEKKNHKWAIEYEGKLYPVKYILSKASGVHVNRFYGGSNPGCANHLLGRLGFQIVKKRERVVYGTANTTTA